MFNWISPQLKITLGLASIVVSALMLAAMLGIIPDHERTVMESRGDICETLAVSGCQLIANGDADQLETLVGFVVDRNDEIVSARVRNIEGETLFVAGSHQWNADAASSLSDETQIFVPLHH